MPSEPQNQMDDNLAISVRNLTKTYRLFNHPGDRIKQFLSLGFRQYHKGFTALRDASFEVRKGETIGVIGRNGSGKSTLLQLICGILKPTVGTVHVSGRISALLELGAGFNSEFTGRENVYFQGALMGLTSSQMDARFDEIAAFADIGAFIEQPVRTYSTGMYVRLAFAAAINVSPDVLVVDEALSVGDSHFQAKCFAKFREFQEKGVTILFVTHSLDLVAQHCERVILLDSGRLAKSGTPKVAIDEYRRLLSAQHYDEPPSILPGEIDTRRIWVGMFELNPTEVRYGSLETEIIEAGLFTSDNKPTQLLYLGEEYLIKIRLISHGYDLCPFVSFVIKDLKGVPLCGTTTSMENAYFDATKAGQLLRVTFRLPMLLNPGNYMLSVGSQAYGNSGGASAHDHRTDYLSFEVIGKLRHGIFSPPTNVSIESESLIDETC